MHLKQSGSTCTPSRQFTKSKDRIQKFKETGNSISFYQNESDKICFHYDMVDGDFKDLPERTNSDKALYNRVFYIAKSIRYRYQRVLPSMVTCFLLFNKKPATCKGTETGFNTVSDNQQLTKELNKPIIRKLKYIF